MATSPTSLLSPSEQPLATGQRPPATAASPALHHRHHPSSASTIRQWFSSAMALLFVSGSGPACKRYTSSPWRTASPSRSGSRRHRSTRCGEFTALSAAAPTTYVLLRGIAYGRYLAMIPFLGRNFPRGYRRLGTRPNLVSPPNQFILWSWSVVEDGVVRLENERFGPFYRGNMGDSAEPETRWTVEEIPARAAPPPLPFPVPLGCRISLTIVFNDVWIGFVLAWITEAQTALLGFQPANTKMLC
ncbi:hypothetical protein BS78_10G051900 [Paspalum vaginatum]|nr:hypothetical protein BS78_10G051900 [Paspalum vaginatum]